MHARSRAVLVAAGLVTFAAQAHAQQAQPQQAAQPKTPPKVEPAQLPADWEQRDFEAKWVAYRTAMAGNPREHGSKAGWMLALGQSRDFELLEAVALYEGWHDAGKELARANAPQLLRAAIWNLGAYDSHDKDTANRVLMGRDATVLGWLHLHPHVVRGKVATLRDKLVAANARPGPADQFAPPLDPMQLLVPMLDAPPTMPEFGDRLQAEPGTRYVHQVLRALGGVLVYGEADDMIVHKVLALTRHDHDQVRRTAFVTLSKLPGGIVPCHQLIVMADDVQATAEQRRLAVMALSFSAHPQAFFRVAAIAREVDHPGNLTAIRRLGELGDVTLPSDQFVLPHGAHDSVEIGLAMAAAAETLAKRRQGGAFVMPDPLWRWLWRCAWLRLRNDERTHAHCAALLDTLRSHADKDMSVAQLVTATLDGPVPISPFRGEEAVQIEAELRRWAAALAK